MDTKVLFRPLLLLLGTAFFAAGTAWLAFGPHTSGPVGRVLSSNGGAVTIVSVACGLGATFLFAFHAIRMALGMPALVASAEMLELYVLPVERFRWSELQDIRIDGGKLLLLTRAGRLRNVNLTILRDCDAAVIEIREALTKQQEQERINAWS